MQRSTMLPSPSTPSAGGFLPSSIPSPPYSAASTSASNPSISATLPRSRTRPLLPGGSKESLLFRYMDSGILRLERRYAKRGTASFGLEKRDEGGYSSFDEVTQDIDKLVDMIWLSGTPGLQVPYLLNLAQLVCIYLPSFGKAPNRTFALLEKLDMAFASLLLQKHVGTGELLPGFEMGGRGVSGTEKVRMKGIIERTRAAVDEVMSRADDGEELESRIGEVTETEMESGDDMDLDGSGFGEDDEDDEEDQSWEIRVSKIYDRTMMALGDTIGNTPIGIISDD